MRTCPRCGQAVDRMGGYDPELKALVCDTCIGKLLDEMDARIMALTREMEVVFDRRVQDAPEPVVR